jgi:hypothetical protein
LMKAGVIEAMTINGIVADDQIDHLIAAALANLTTTDDEVANPCTT